MAEIWGKLVIDGHPVVAEYIKEDNTPVPVKKVRSGNLSMSEVPNIYSELLSAMIRNAVVILDLHT